MAFENPREFMKSMVRPELSEVYAKLEEVLDKIPPMTFDELDIDKLEGYYAVFGVKLRALGSLIIVDVCVAFIEDCDQCAARRVKTINAVSPELIVLVEPLVKVMAFQASDTGFSTTSQTLVNPSLSAIANIISK